MNNKFATLMIKNEKYVLDKIIVNYMIPILLVYRMNDEYYLMSCLDFDEYQYLLYNISKPNLISLLRDEIKIGDAFISDLYSMIEFNKDFKIVKEIDFTSSDLPEDYLPEVDEFLGLSHLCEVNEYSKKLEKSDINSHVQKIYQFKINSQGNYLDFGSDKYTAQFDKNFYNRKSKIDNPYDVKNKVFYIGVKHPNKHSYSSKFMAMGEKIMKGLTQYMEKNYKTIENNEVTVSQLFSEIDKKGYKNGDVIWRTY